MAAVCVLAALLTGCSRDPNVRKQKYLESGQRYFDKGQYREAEIQFQNAIQVDARFAEPTKAGAGGDKTAAVANRLPGTVDDRPTPARLTMPLTLTWPIC